MDLGLYFEERRRRVDAFLDSHFRGIEGPFSKLYEAMRYSLLAGGKRLRPVLTLASFEACLSDGPRDPKKETAALRIASAMEMIHTYSLIHDDLPAMDNDDLRRGRPTNHKVFGEALAILAGDALLTDAFGVIAQSDGIFSDILIQIIGDLAEASGGKGMAGGQAIDLQSQGNQGKKISPEELEHLHRQKTGCLIEVSVMAGAKLAGADKPLLRSMKTYGETVGLAFQIADDILDVEGGSAEMGKATGGDARKEKATYPSILGLERSKGLARELAEQAIEALRSLDKHADPLREIARYVVNRQS